MTESVGVYLTSSSDEERGGSKELHGMLSRLVSYLVSYWFAFTIL